MCSGAASGGDTPEGDVGAKPFRGGQALEEVDVWDLEAQKTDEEERGDVGELVAFEVKIGCEAHYCCVLETRRLDLEYDGTGQHDGTGLTFKITLSRNCKV